LLLFTWWIAVLVPNPALVHKPPGCPPLLVRELLSDPALVHEPPGCPPLLVGELLSGGRDALANLALEKFELVVAVDAHQLRVETPAGA